MTLSKTQSTLVKGGLITLLLLLAGCSTKADKSLYNWDNYQTTVYQYYQGDKVGPEEQIASLKESIEKSRATNKAVPPGLHAQLGLLYANTGHTDLAFQEFNTEKSLFPESATYMDFLLKNKGKTK
ncbi:MAG: DUF4810 domain-containing protein [Rahnella inusitata]|jgi:hypothetical protein|uniref:DUF4810 domain-containing protein n=1 Tax=Rahnella inusitata TaxID=58169 RepID=A0ABX9NW94_9GAMM|nr:DUF4810 domain-containing protein [Rahnella inusitata]NMC22865.1 DUF4810 domain-containing protein [Serratia sp. (in: enterobacteria)]QUT16491.1 DUF4810 domain-containing protein [Rahnella inusitata]RJT11158.1 DUF4810 domain-containing protein [Rahnella inusitata]